MIFDAEFYVGLFKVFERIQVSQKTREFGDLEVPGLAMIRAAWILKWILHNLQISPWQIFNYVIKQKNSKVPTGWFVMICISLAGTIVLAM